MRAAFAMVLSLVAMVAGVRSQDPVEPEPRGLAGTYQVKDANGRPLDPTCIDRVHIVPLVGTPLFYCFWTEDYGNGPVVVSDPDAEFIAMPTTNGDYVWESISGNYGGYLRRTRYGYLQEWTNPPQESNQFHRE